MDFNNYWTIGMKSSVYRNRLYVEFGGVDAHVNHIHSNMIFDRIKKVTWTASGLLMCSAKDTI